MPKKRARAHNRASFMMVASKATSINATQSFSPAVTFFPQCQRPTGLGPDHPDEWVKRLVKALGNIFPQALK